MNRADGWPALQAAYELPQQDVRGLDHDLAYRGLASGAIDVMDLYSTDAKIAQYDVAVLTDDLGLFPRYDAVVLYRQDLVERAPGMRGTGNRAEPVDEQIAVGLGVVDDELAVLERLAILKDVRRDHDDDLGPLDGGDLLGEQPADDREVAEEGNPADALGVGRLDQTADDDGLAVTNHDVGRDLGGVLAG